ncbi:DNA-directed RNA polymerase subunit beta' [Eggerthellaceae bacterium zg-1084]|uniref:DNA-directed RNA polymerase subunit beta' n=1 Tax=Berryella wangjianweii TaxID=2734634 RepID=A0A6M8J5B2_9ACTN|nr:DNA-directed RNA polymerase subunit beta' [Berryella wangjianweii]NPD30491.1 DNA-directed RNA polymerase subunit beta' [Berryella wangjianweii]NPD32794.1 DNA-directed RNA polymerase subunit beta' [Eggerthellaceae bacterium zg-997]QKF07156.1 DNA-directed RNA polymerase subunit beta' [Berryella wangjianweii]
MTIEFDVTNFDDIRISLASAEDIRGWSRGEVKKPETINYRTLKPEKDGLYCEKIFGPTKDWECACGKYKRVRFKGIVCERCGVEVTRSKVRRERMGHIELAAPVSHIWYFKGSPSRLGYLLEISPKELEKVLYFASSIITSVDHEAREEDLDELRDDLAADLEELDAERDRLVASTRRLSTDYVPEEDEFVDDIDDDERLTPEEVEEEIADIYEEFNERKALRQEAFEAFQRIEPKQLLSDDALYREMRANYRDYFTGGMGAEAVRDLLEAIDLEATAEELTEVIATGKGQKRAKAIKRLKVVDAFLKSENKPSDMILDVIPVIPPDLRPMVQLDGGRFATSDLNDLYRRVINRNNRLKRLLDLGAPEIIVNNEKRMLQEAVDSLFDNGRRGRPVTGPGNRPLKSLSDMLKGKQGRFRQNLLGKRVDYSGRSVIVVGPELQMHQCGLPSKMALELFKPFVMKRLVELEYSLNIKAAKRAVDRGASYVWDVLEEVIREHPVLLNRAPTLHRLGIQAFEPVLVEGKAIKLHPLVCTAFNADFDGDQMAVHVPLSAAAQAEARILMLSTNNIKSPAHGRPLTVPTQDMIIGLYYLTAARDGFPGEGRAFVDFADARAAYDARADVDLQAKVLVRLTEDTQVAHAFDDIRLYKAGERIETTIGRITFNDVLPDDYPFLNYEMNKSQISRLVEDVCNVYPDSEVPRILDGLKSEGFHYATRAGVTVSVYDATIPPEKKAILGAADAKVAGIDEEYEMGLMSYDERHRQIVDIWNKANDEVGDAMAANFDKFNPIYMMAFSGARGNIKQIRQLAGMRGLMSDPKGEIIDRPIKANFREGLTVLEYFISTHGARKGLADTALRTADSGYLTRRLVDVAQDVIIREIDCGTAEGVPYALHDEKGELDENLIGRCLLEDAVSPEGEVLMSAGDYVSSMKQIRELEQAGLEEVVIRTVMTCHAHDGVCQKCYGWDLATARPVNIGTAVGIIAAQSIGEPGTQLTMRTFHTGGVAGDDITHGLPRVQELFEARKPKGLAVLAEIAGTLQISGDKNQKVLTIHDEEGNFREYEVSARAQMQPGVTDGCQVKVGQQLTRGSVNPHDLLRLTDPNTTLRYIVSQVQGVYVSQGVDINDKHIEVVARQMLRKLTVLDAGDSSYLPGLQVNRYEFKDAADSLIAEGKEPPVGQPLLLGITKASLATDSWMSAASFQETTKVLTDAAIEGKVDSLRGLKENVIIGKPIPAGTGLKRYRSAELTYKGQAIAHAEGDALPEYAPDALREIEDLLPQPQDWTIDDGYLVPGGESYGRYGYPGHRGVQLTDEEARLYIFDDLGVSQRWANKFSEVGIETVADLVGHTEDDLLRIEGIGAKALEELKAGLAAHDLSSVIEEELTASSDDMSQLLDMVFSPDDNILIGGDTPATFSTEGEDMLGEALPPRSYQRNLEELDALLGSMGSYGFGITSREDEEAANSSDQ